MTLFSQVSFSIIVWCLFKVNSTSYSCGTETCSSTNLDCTEPGDCIVECPGETDCYNTTITCGSLTSCYVNCSYDRSCKYITINAQDALYLEVSLYSFNYGYTAQHAEFYCPNSGRENPQCKINCMYGSFCCDDLDIYAVEGFNDFAFNDFDLYTAYYVEIFCGESYSYRCDYDYGTSSPNYHCFSTSTEPIDYCETYLIPTSVPTTNPTVPTTNPTVPSNSPTSLPSNSPTSLPSNQPSDAPTNSPINDPTTSPTTSYPTIGPSNFPTNIPTQITQTTKVQLTDSGADDNDNTNNLTSKDDTNGTTGIIIGFLIGAVIACLIVILYYYFCIFVKNQNKKQRVFKASISEDEHGNNSNIEMLDIDINGNNARSDSIGLEEPQIKSTYKKNAAPHIIDDASPIASSNIEVDEHEDSMDEGAGIKKAMPDINKLNNKITPGGAISVDSIDLNEDDQSDNTPDDESEEHSDSSLQHIKSLENLYGKTGNANSNPIKQLIDSDDSDDGDGQEIMAIMGNNNQEQKINIVPPSNSSDVRDVFVDETAPSAFGVAQMKVRDSNIMMSPVVVNNVNNDDEKVLNPDNDNDQMLMEEGDNVSDDEILTPQ